MKMVASKICIFLITIQMVYTATAQEVVRRVPQGFLGMRGKKYTEYGESEFYKRKPQFFVGVKGKKNFDSFPDVEYKRAPMGFVGMRGKKESLYPEFMIAPDSYDYVPKQSGSLIGQIDYSTEDMNGVEYPMLNEVINEYLNKLRSNLNNEMSTEAPDTSDERINEVEKRANIHKFFGVRGKKSVQEKRPYDVSFRGKFIGVRGKKDVKNTAVQGTNLLFSGPWSKKNVRTGFLGMRGKKWTDDDNVLDSEESSEIVMPN